MFDAALLFDKMALARSGAFVEIKMKKTLVFAAALLAFGGAYAQKSTLPVYGEVGYSFIKIEDESDDIKLGALRGIAGIEVHPNVALEGMIGFGVKDENINILGTDVKVKLERFYGLYVKPKLKVTNELELFARLGYAHSKVKASALGTSSSDSEGDASYGVGASYSFSPRAYGTIDYMSYYNKDGVKANGVTLGVGFRF